MSAAISQPSSVQPAARAHIGEWFWRFLAVVMLVIIAWVVWIAIQISPPEMVLPAAYEAAAQARALRNSAGAISTLGTPGPSALPGAPAGAAAAVPGTPDPAQPPVAAPVAVVAPAAPAEPPVNLDKLRLADSIETPIFERSRRRATPAIDATR